MSITEWIADSTNQRWVSPDGRSSDFKSTVEPPPDGGTWAASRDVYAHPFPADSIWNRPIGAAASYTDALFGPQTQGGGAGFYRVQVDDEHHGLNPADPVKVMQGGGEAVGQSLHVPSSMTADGTPNHCWAFLDAGSDIHVWQGQPLSLTAGGNPSTKNTRPGHRVHLAEGTDASRLGSHGGSGLSAIGGSVRPGEIDSGVIHHALKINVNARKYLSRTDGGFRWPAVKADGGYDDPSRFNYYDGSVPECRMGSLVALQPGYDQSWITHAKVATFATALEHYGAYIVDNTGWDVYAFCMDEEVRLSNEFPYNQTGSAATETFHTELILLIQDLYVVDNNAAGGTTAGGGSPIAANLYAPTTLTGLP